MNDYSKIDSFLETNLDRSLNELSELVAQPSVGAQNLGIRECAALVAEMLKARGFDVRVMDTKGAPVVLVRVIRLYTILVCRWRLQDLGIPIQRRMLPMKTFASISTINMPVTWRA
jgi:hypothetical protein